ncbi:hypothetical protein P3L10_013366 [Capsicum annuum]
MDVEINNCAMSQANNSGNWVCWPSPPMLMVPQSLPLERPVVQPPQSHQKNGSTDKKQAIKTEKNLKFLLQKMRKQSDVNNLGRIVLLKVLQFYILINGDSYPFGNLTVIQWVIEIFCL